MVRLGTAPLKDPISLLNFLRWVSSIRFFSLFIAGQEKHVNMYSIKHKLSSFFPFMNIKIFLLLCLLSVIQIKPLQVFQLCHFDPLNDFFFCHFDLWCYKLSHFSSLNWKSLTFSVQYWLIWHVWDVHVGWLDLKHMLGLIFFFAFMQDNWSSILFAMAGGVVLSLGNLSTQYAWAFVGLSVVQVISSSMTVVIG